MSTKKYTNASEAFALFAQIAEATGDRWRAIAYKRASVAGIMGADLAAKAEEFCRTGAIRELDDLLAQPRTRTILELSSIMGFGPKTIKDLLAYGIESRAQLMDLARRRSINLSRIQELGLIHYDDLARKIPRITVARAADIIQPIAMQTISELYSVDAARDAKFEVTGSYRRQSPFSHDVDILISASETDQKSTRTRTSGNNPGRRLLHELHEKICTHPAFVETLSLGTAKYSFLMRMDWVISVDIIYAPRKSYYSALLYFTGSQRFNIQIREICKKKGFTLNQYNLTAPDGEIIYLESERQLFDMFELKYLEPRDR